MTAQIMRAVEILRGGGLVAFPTETVYGLGADATSAAGVRRIFQAKGRPATNPLIAHVASAEVARRYAAHWPGEASALARAFWPGPLTLVLPKAAAIAAEATAGLPSVGLRCPDHPLALELLRAFDGPVAAPSANRSTRVSPTTAEHVREELGDRVDLVLDGGACRVGIESTVLDLAFSVPRILRPGGVMREQIEAVIGPVALAAGVVEPGIAAPSPGQHARHYSPQTPTWWFAAERRDEVVAAARGAAVMLVGPGSVAEAKVVEMPELAPQYARRLYETLRRLDGSGVSAIYIEMPPDTPSWAAVRDRIRRAGSEWVARGA